MNAAARAAHSTNALEEFVSAANVMLDENRRAGAQFVGIDSCLTKPFKSFSPRWMKFAANDDKSQTREHLGRFTEYQENCPAQQKATWAMEAERFHSAIGIIFVLRAEGVHAAREIALARQSEPALSTNAEALFSKAVADGEGNLALNCRSTNRWLPEVRTGSKLEPQQSDAGNLL
ncbi:hypothetical protein NDN08_006871 [Rhodosorus marinus]|uniref:Uncharacterized protein n=1 Tax=Rhodosorus marinus TaxID=101924 RepID=A0AAV8UIX1_9RHOD|nr:hypothetical protein NDN08_006871 [Rhodosorus marinus]